MEGESKSAVSKGNEEYGCCRRGSLSDVLEGLNERLNPILGISSVSSSAPCKLSKSYFGSSFLSFFSVETDEI